MPFQLALAAVLIGGQAPARPLDLGPDTCVSGYVWREAFPDDHVCVTPEVRAQAADDNRRAAERREPGGGAYGPDTCRAGFVWRDAKPGDHVCVTPETRAQAARDNEAAAKRYARARGAVAVGVKRPGVAVFRPDAIAVRQPQVTPVPSPPPPRSGSAVRRGFDENGEPYIEETLDDGSIRREQQRGVTVIAPDGSRRFYPNQRVYANAQPPTPPQLPSDPALGRAWVSFHNDQLLNLIRALVNDDSAQMQTFTAKEGEVAGSDVFKQVEYRTRVLQFLARP